MNVEPWLTFLFTTIGNASLEDSDLQISPESPSPLLPVRLVRCITLRATFSSSRSLPVVG